MLVWMCREYGDVWGCFETALKYWNEGKQAYMKYLRCLDWSFKLKGIQDGRNRNCGRTGNISPSLRCFPIFTVKKLTTILFKRNLVLCATCDDNFTKYFCYHSTRPNQCAKVNFFPKCAIIEYRPTNCKRLEIRKM